MAKLRNIWDNLNKAVFFITLTISILLIVTSFILPPTGQIDPSVLAATGELFAWCPMAAVITAIEKGKGVSLTKGDASININKDTNDESTEI